MCVAGSCGPCVEVLVAHRVGLSWGTSDTPGATEGSYWVCDPPTSCCPHFCGLYGHPPKLRRRVETVRGCCVCATDKQKLHHMRTELDEPTHYSHNCTWLCAYILCICVRPPLRLSSQSYQLRVHSCFCAVPARVVYFCNASVRLAGVPLLTHMAACTCT